MKKFIKEFCIRGMMFAWGGPFITAIVWLSLKAAGKIDALDVNQVFIGIFSTSFLAFIAAGITAIHQIDTLPKPFAALIHASILFIDYLGIYILNGWMDLKHLWIFTLCFFAGFAIIWLSIYLPIRIKVEKMNRMLEES